MPNRGTVLVLDHEEKVIHRLRAVLGAHGYSVVAFSTVESLFAYQFPNEPLCAIIDAELPGSAASELQGWLRRIRPGVPVIHVAGHGEIRQAVEAIRGGATDYLTKPLDESSLVYAVQRAFVEQEEVRSEWEELASFQRRFERLTPREKEVCAG